MTSPTSQTQDNKPVENKPVDKELNFRQLEARYERQLAQERAERERLEQELKQRQQPLKDDDDDDDEPYVDKKRLDKKLAKFGQQSKQETQSEIQRAVQIAIEKERQENWLKNNGDFNEVMGFAESFAEKNPELAEDILKMPASFERQKIVYNNIKALGLHKPVQKQPTIQDKIDANRRSPFYQPTGIGSAPYAGQESDFSEQGKKDAHAKMKELQSRLRLS